MIWEELEELARNRSIAEWRAFVRRWLQDHPGDEVWPSSRVGDGDDDLETAIREGFPDFEDEED